MQVEMGRERDAVAEEGRPCRLTRKYTGLTFSVDNLYTIYVYVV